MGSPPKPVDSSSSVGGSRCTRAGPCAKAPDPRVRSDAPARVPLRWGIEHSLAVLPKSATEARIKENAAIFDFTLDPDAKASVDACEEGLVTGWDPHDQT